MLLVILDVTSLTGLLPPIVRSSQNHAGIWCEFDRDWPKGSANSIQPIVWFKFWTKPQALGYLKAGAMRNQEIRMWNPHVSLRLTPTLCPASGLRHNS